MPQIRNGVVCVAVLMAGFIASFFSFQPLQPPPAEVQTLPAERAAAAVLEESAPRFSFPAPTSERAERRLEAGTVHIYPLTVKPEDLVELIVEQDGVDLQVSVRDSDKILFIVDGDNYRDGPERLLLAAKETRSYSIEVSGRSPGEAGRYLIRIAAERPATEQDRMEAQAEELFHQGKEALKSGDLRSSEPKLIEAGRLWKETGNAERRAVVLKMLGDLYRAQESWEKSLDILRHARALFRQEGRLGKEGHAANDIGYAFEKLARMEEAREMYNDALLLGERSKLPDLTAAALYNLGNLARRSSRSGEALKHLHRARLIWKELEDLEEIEALCAIGGVFAETGEYEKAMSYLREALKLAGSRGGLQRQATVLALMGNALSRVNPEQARHHYDKAIEIQRRLGDLDGLASTLNGIGLLHLSRKEHQEALSPLQRALRIYRQKRNQLDGARTLTNLGYALTGLRRENDARAAFETAISQAADLDRLAEAAARAGLAQLEQKLGNPIEARKQAEAAVRTVETMRAESRTDLRVRLLANRQGIYDTLIEILMWQHELSPNAGIAAQAFDVSELARTRGLLDSVSGFEARTGVSPSPDSLANYRSQIDPDTLLLEFHLGRNVSYLWVVDRTDLHALKLPPRDQINKLADDVRRLLPAHGRNLDAARRAAAELSRVLLKPATPWLSRKRLVISVPDLLQGIPFGVLPDPRALDSLAGRKRWPDPLILNHEIVKIPSLSVLDALRRRAMGRTPPPGLLGILFDPVFELTHDRFGKESKAQFPVTVETSSSPGGFTRLQFADDEANAILEVAGSRGVFAVSGFNASRDVVIKGNLRGFRNIHFTAHGRLQAQDADLSALVLSQYDRQGRSVDGFLRASDIVKLKLPSDLVVLSACETGLGEQIPGEGLVGLPQAFMAAGATRVLVSLWPIEDRASSGLMGRFYEDYLAEGRSPAAALRQAQIAMWQSNWNAPFYWGAFELQGDWRPASSPR
jgi:CHAT domain-containing protein/uncharacterized protein HemY